MIEDGRLLVALGLFGISGVAAVARGSRGGSRGVVRRGRLPQKPIRPGAVADLVREAIESYNADGCMEMDADELAESEGQLRFHGIDSDDNYFEDIYQVVFSYEDTLAFWNDELGVGLSALRSKP